MGRPVWKKLLLVVCIASCLFLLSGCSFSDLMSWGTGVKGDPDYQTWEKLSESGKLDSEGKYAATAVHVTFSKNNFLDIHYFSNSDMTEEIPDTGCYLLPGDIIYYSVDTVRGSENIYYFDRLDIIEYDSDNNRGSALNWLITDSSSLLIPYDYKGTEVSIEPAGHFGSRQMVFHASTIDGASISNGRWYIDNEAASSETVSVNALNSYCVEYRFDPTQYYLVSASPEPWKSDEGIVVFEISDAKTGSETYFLAFDKYMAVNIAVQNGEILSIADNSNTVLSRKTDARNWVVSKVRSGTKINVQASTGDQNNIQISSPLQWKVVNGPLEQNINGQLKYDYEIEFGDTSRFMLIPSEYTYPHGTIEFSSNGTVIIERTTLESGSEIQYIAKSIDEGYWLPNNGGTIIVNGSETATELHNIRFYPQKTVSVLLPQPIAGGRIVYSTEDGVLDGASAELVCGMRIYADFNADNGWESKLPDHSIYVVPETNNQSVSFGNISINDIFRENEGHKPDLTVRINRNVGKCLTSISASGYRLTDQSVTDGDNILDALKTVVSSEKIGTDQSIVLTFNNIDLLDNNNTLRITVNKETKNGGYKEIYYVNKANTPLSIPLNKDKEYSAVRIQIEGVKADPFTYMSITDADISVRFEDITPDMSSDSVTITAGTLISGERRINVTIIPHTGFYIDGAYVKDNTYSRSMTYDEYTRLSPDEIQKQVKMICSINLVTEDEFGDVEYLVDGVSLSGITEIKEGKEILVRYTLKDDSYEIVGDRDIFTQAVNLIDNSVSRKIEVRIKVAPEHNNTDLHREDVIEIRKKVSE